MGVVGVGVASAERGSGLARSGLLACGSRDLSGSVGWWWLEMGCGREEGLGWGGDE